ncbi:hypothetical protein V1514DRAFT_331030 [Lipomyces japonicus]|uniref:uncharacterized protein n=1 Tax=Lipomyces japonicus TaxID=56871 RepID=UPI0034CE1518
MAKREQVANGSATKRLVSSTSNGKSNTTPVSAKVRSRQQGDAAHTLGHESLNEGDATPFETPATTIQTNGSRGHVRFGDDEISTPVPLRNLVKKQQESVIPPPPTPGGYFTADEQLSSDDNDEAPEDLSFSGSKAAVEAQEKSRVREIETKRHEDRAKRRANEQRLQVQKEEKLKREQAQKQDVPLFLPANVLSQVTTTPVLEVKENTGTVVHIEKKRKKIVFTEPAVRDIPKDQVTFRVLKKPSTATLAAPAKTKIIKSRDRWLKRKTAKNAKSRKIQF